MQKINKNQNVKRKNAKKKRMKLIESKNKRKNSVKRRKKNYESKFHMQRYQI